MRTIIAGSRTIFNLGLVDKATRDCGWKITEVVCGCAAGVDILGAQWAIGHRVSIRSFPANWREFGRKAGPIRNVLMGDYADTAIVIHNGSRGSLHMVKVMRELGKPVFEVFVDKL